MNTKEARISKEIVLELGFTRCADCTCRGGIADMSSSPRIICKSGKKSQELLATEVSEKCPIGGAGLW